MTILGIHEGHDSSAAIIVDGKIIADVQEERFNRVKHSGDTPLNAIHYCLAAAGLESINDVDYVSIPWLQIPDGLKTIFNISESFNWKQRIFRKVFKLMFRSPFDTSWLRAPIYKEAFAQYEGQIKSYDHHLCHAASAYYTQSDTDKHLIFTIDGIGDNTCTTVWLAEGNQITPLKKYGSEAAIGWAYSLVTEGLHWIHGDGEGKTMGLAPYGDYNVCKGLLDPYFPEFEGTELKKEVDLGAPYVWNEKGASQYHLTKSSEVEQLIQKYGKENIAAEAQRKLEESVIELVKGWVDQTGIKKTCFAGGVMLNVKLNQRLWNNRASIGIEKQHIYPNPGDSGVAVGAALLEYYKHHSFEGSTLDSLYGGPEYSNKEIEGHLQLSKLNYQYLDEPAKTAAQLLSENKIIGWFQGRMESGPRALGNRSILMSPLMKGNKAILNERVKFRESFRPFCPSLLFESRDKYLLDSKDEFFMMASFDCVESKINQIPAVVHEDGTLRPQLVKKEQNPLFWQLIKEFETITGESIVLNTSMNVMGEPIVNTPSDAIKCFYSTGIDALFIGNYLITK
ncbi:carbamoyltransferase family protein [Marinoscillum pacificum]|uniref:carbamoyltransferase family protein n=1 Tax=Marinoscillum pacificum TaxID=392723 RepID=UPI0021581538|nr:carbamoyltransferase C-terminal domain-containing protein [Marinoscillum pacificum]